MIRLALSELRRYRLPVQRIALAFLVLLPSLYGGLYLWSNWDPYGNLGDIKVAVVNEDEAVQVEGQDAPVRAGDQVVDELEADPIVDWTPTDADDAATGLADGTYLMSITIPADFTARLASVQNDDPQTAEIVLHRDGANGFIVGVAARGLSIELQEKINAAATAAYFTVVFQQLGELRSGLATAADGAHQLEDGLSTAHDGAGTLADGLGTARSGVTQLTDGANQVADGNRQIADLVDPIADELIPAIPPVADAAANLTSATAQLTSVVADAQDGIATRTGSVLDQLNALVAANPGDQALVAARDAAALANERAGQITEVTTGVNAAAQDIASRAAAVDAQVPAIQQQLRQGRSDIDRLASGSRQVADGLTELGTGLDTAVSGAQQLNDGTGQLLTGATTLADGLDSAVNQIPDLGQDDPEGTADQVANPTTIRTEAENDAEFYGEGLAPFFFGIALCVFGVAGFTVLRPINPRGLASRARPITVALAGFLPVAVIGVAGGWVLTGIVGVGLGLDARSWPATLGLVTVGSLAFTAIAHALRTAFGVVGSAVALVLLMVQLTSCAGIYPVQTLPAPFQAVHPLLPMTYVVDGLRIAMTGGPGDRLLRDFLVVGGIGLLGVAAGIAAAAWRRRWALAQLKPVLGE
ncbi:YhgE/Pip domain-containing protein [Cellulomonas sp. NPDC089187]|uniref:YhgE/Pip domain-containing protein n=1 Tax=Cellulomonas sp. NPDC089187 TaxID=3154970 RepID=UPI0034348C61